MRSLTEKQRKILQYIEKYLNETSYPPTIREVGDAFGITAKGAYDHLKAIEKKGYIRSIKNRSRAIELLKSPAALSFIRENTQSIPLVGQVAAGAPIVAEENIEEYLSFPKSMVSGEELFALRVRGTSMKDAGIFDGDVAILKKQETATDGDIVVALIDDEATLKYFYRERDGKVRLQPANSEYKPLYTDRAAVLAKLVGVYRNFN